MDTSKNLQPLLAGRKTVFENRRILRYLRIAGRVPRANLKQFDAPDDEDQGFERCPGDGSFFGLYGNFVENGGGNCYRASVPR